LHIDGKELLSQKQKEGNNIYVTLVAQMEDLKGKPTRGVMVMTSSSSSTIQVESYNKTSSNTNPSRKDSHIISCE
jgi:hypothetical protein